MADVSSRRKESAFGRRTRYRNDPTMLDHRHSVKRRIRHPAAEKGMRRATATPAWIGSVKLGTT
jgi:hypothetical protein